MEQPVRAAQTPPAAPRAVDPDALPPSAARRAQLLFMLIILPVLAVSLPAILVTMIFGQKPTPKPARQDTRGLQTALQQSASTMLPTPSTLTGEPIKLTCRPERLAARAEKVGRQAEAFGGTANEWLAPDGEKHFYVELPAGRAEAFRQSLAGDAPLAATLPPPAAGARDQVEVFIHANSDE